MPVGKLTNEGPLVSFSIRMPRAVVDRVDGYAERNRRSRNVELIVLAEEALAARDAETGERRKAK